MRSDWYSLPWGAQQAIRRSDDASIRAAYWRNAYELLVKQTGRDLNDGLGLDPRRDPRSNAKA